jgi:hypothetical protein
MREPSVVLEPSEVAELIDLHYLRGYVYNPKAVAAIELALLMQYEQGKVDGRREAASDIRQTTVFNFTSPISVKKPERYTRNART